MKMGRRQRKMLTDMAIFGEGAWPEHWRLRFDDKEVLDALERKGLVAGRRLTEQGTATAMIFMSEAQRELSVKLAVKRRAGVL